MSWEYAPELDAAHRAVLTAGKPLVYVCPPAAWAARPLFAALSPAAGSPATVVIVPDAPLAVELTGLLTSLPHLAPIHPAASAGRAQQLLRGRSVRTLVAPLPIAAQLVSRAALKLETVIRVVLAWPELSPSDGARDALDTLLAECQTAQRIVLTTEDGATADLIERHARRAPVVSAARLPERPAGRIRYAIVEPQRRAWAARATLEHLNPATAVIWDPAPAAETRWAHLIQEPGVALLGSTPDGADLAIAADLPSADALQTLHAAARDVVVLLSAPQMPYLSRLATTCEALRLGSAADDAGDWLSRLRRDVRAQLERDPPLAELVALNGLFEEHDPALVAAALLALRGTPPDRQEATGDAPAWVRVHVNAGKRDQLRPGDLVGALLNAVGLGKDDIGRIDVKEGFTVFDVRAREADRAVRGLTGVALRGRRIAARRERP